MLEKDRKARRNDNGLKYKIQVCHYIVSSETFVLGIYYNFVAVVAFNPFSLIPEYKFMF